MVDILDDLKKDKEPVKARNGKNATAHTVEKAAVKAVENFQEQIEQKNKEKMEQEVQEQIKK